MMRLVRIRVLLCCFLVILTMGPSFISAQEKTGNENQPALHFTTRYQTEISADAGRYHLRFSDVQWNPETTAVIVCDMWDSHHCVNAVRRVGQLAPRIDAFCKTLRQRGVTIIHAPSSCMETYASHPSRLRAKAVPAAKKFPADIATWCDQIPSEEKAAYPVDQSDGGEDDETLEHKLWAERLAAIGRNPRSPWKAQVARIAIDADKDYISDSGTEIWSILTNKDIEQVVLVGVHTNMCVLGRPFGLRRLSAAGKQVVLCRDLIDTMYNPDAWPFASHFTGTDLVVSHIEKFVCPTITSDQILGGQPLRFAKDNRPRLVMLVAEDEYETEHTLPPFAAKHLSKNFSVQILYGSETERHHIEGMSAVRSADAILVSVRRRALGAADMSLLQEFVASGKPVIGIRTASHAFSLRGKLAPDGKAVWDKFDAEVFGGNYSGHYGNNLKSTLSMQLTHDSDPILASTSPAVILPGGSLYKTAPLAPGANTLLLGKIESEEAEHPVAWTFVRGDGGRSFYTSLGHKDDFAQPEFEALLSAGIHWACGLPAPTLQETIAQNKRYANGKGKQR